MPPTTPSRKELTHERIVETAARAIRSAGFQGMGVADIMKAAGLTHGGFYAHFASRDALLAEALERAGEESAQHLDRATARHGAQGVSPLRALVESYLSGPEFTVAVLGNGDETRCLPIVGLRFDALPEGAPPIYGYEAKWLWDTLEQPLEIYQCPAAIPDDFAQEIRNISLGAYHALGCRDWCRIDAGDGVRALNSGSRQRSISLSSGFRTSVVASGNPSSLSRT